MNLNTLPTIEQAQAQLDAINYLCGRWSIRHCLPFGTSCVWMDMNDEWGLKICYNDKWGFVRTQENGIAAYELGFGPYVDSTIHTVTWDDVLYDAYFMQKARRITWDEFNAHPDRDTLRREWERWGYYDISAPNCGELDGRIVLIDTSHRERSEAAINGRCKF